jgi:hypothetical protein
MCDHFCAETHREGLNGSVNPEFPGWQRFAEHAPREIVEITDDYMKARPTKVEGGIFVYDVITWYRLSRRRPSA